MDGLLSGFLAALIAEQGDTSQLLALAAVARFGAGPRVSAGLLLAAALGAALAAAGGGAAHLLVPYRGALLLVALALLFAGFGMAFAPKPPKVALYPRLGAAGAVTLATFVQTFGDRTQFLVFALAARSDAAWLVGLGGAAGTCLGLAPALVLHDAFPRVWPVTILRRAGAVLLGLAGLFALVSALRLI